MTEEDLAALRSRYLGVDKKKRKIRKMNDRKFVFDWDEQEDTFTADPSANVGGQRQGAQVMFGRGHLAGMDDGGGARPGTKSDVQLADAMERRKAAKHGYDDRHWTEKSLDEMKERDWRIFREDFSIAARGLCWSSAYLVSHPLTAAQVATSHIHYVHGTNPLFLNRSLQSSTRLVTRTPHPFSVRLSLSDCRTAILLVLRRQVGLDSPGEKSAALTGEQVPEKLRPSSFLCLPLSRICLHLLKRIATWGPIP